MKHWLACWRKCLDCSGRSSRKEYWMCCVVSFAIAALLMIPILLLYVRICLRHDVSPLSAGVGGSLIWMCLWLFVGFPCFAADIRRLHDVGRSGWWELLWLVPVWGWIKGLGLLLRHGEKGENRYGAPPAE